MEDTDGIKLFEDPEKDQNNKVHFNKTLKVLIPMITSFGFLGFYLADSWQEAIWNHIIYSWIVGLIGSWTFTEYYFHRFLLHRELNLDLDAPADGKHNADIFSTHVHHHVFTNQKHRIVLNLATYKTYVTWAFVVLSLLTRASIVFSLLFGWIGGSVVYDLLHYSYHHGPDLPFAWYEHMKAAHMRHHYRDNSKEFGVTSPLWDHFFISQRAHAKSV